MTITWTVDDEYVGNGTYETAIDDSDLEECETEEEREELIKQEIQYDFENRVLWSEVSRTD